MSKLTCKVKFEDFVVEEKKCILVTEEDVAALPEGIAGQFLQKTEDGYQFINLPFEEVANIAVDYVLSVYDEEGTYYMEFYPLNELVEEMIQNAFPLAGEGGLLLLQVN